MSEGVCRGHAVIQILHIAAWHMLHASMQQLAHKLSNVVVGWHDNDSDSGRDFS